MKVEAKDKHLIELCDILKKTNLLLHLAQEETLLVTSQLPCPYKLVCNSL